MYCFLRFQSKRARDDEVRERIAYHSDGPRPRARDSDKPRLPFWMWPRFWYAVTQKFLISLNDSQLFTGTAVQIASIIQQCTISVYHFQVVTELAFLSTITHFLTLVVCYQYFAYNRWSNLPRVLVMLLNLGLLGYTSWFGYAYETSKSDRFKSSKLACYYSDNKPILSARFYIRWSILFFLALVGHLSIFFQIYFGKKYWEEYLRSGFEEHSWTNRSSWVDKYVWINLLIFSRKYILLPAYTIYGLVNATRVLKGTQAFGEATITIEGSEKEWGFGQILAVLLLALVLLPGWESFVR